MTDPTSTDPSPRTWVLLGGRSGDNQQLLALADALPWPCTVRQLAYAKRWPGWTPLYGRKRPSLDPLLPESRTAVTPPWPDLILSIGWRSVPVARWIATRSQAKVVALGRPRAPLDVFDLILTTPQYGLPPAPNVVELAAPVTAIDAAAREAAATIWRPRLQALPRPWIAVLAGGDAPPFHLSAEAAERLRRDSVHLADSLGGSLLVATSPRTSAAAEAALLADIPVPHHRFAYSEGGDNPYRGYLALADEIVVTTDSVSMIFEAAATGKPLHLFTVPRRGAWVLRTLEALDTRARASDGVLHRSYFAAVRGGWLYPPRRPDLATQQLLASGQAVVLGNGRPRQRPALESSRERAVRAVVELLKTSSGPSF